MPEPPNDVAVDASVLINLVHAGRLRLLVDLRRFRALLPEDVLEEILFPEQRAAVETAIQAGYFEPVRVDDPAVLETFAELRTSLGRGEAACLALAQHRGLMVASDEKCVFLRLARQRLGEGRISPRPTCSSWPSARASCRSRRPIRPRSFWRRAGSGCRLPRFGTL